MKTVTQFVPGVLVQALAIVHDVEELEERRSPINECVLGLDHVRRGEVERDRGEAGEARGELVVHHGHLGELEVGESVRMAVERNALRITHQQTAILMYSREHNDRF